MFKPSSWGDRRRTRIGLLGGSFNPAHEGHIHISELARKHLGLSQVWWMVSPQNPLKDSNQTAPLNERLANACRFAEAPWIHITALEQDFGTSRTWQTLHILKQRFPNARFVWLMGADNLVQMPLWSRWSKIFQSVHIAVFDRSPYSYSAVLGKASRRFMCRRIQANRALALWSKRRPHWVYFALRRHGASSTEIRHRLSVR